MTEQMVKMLVDKQMDLIDLDKLLQEERERWERDYRSSDLLTQFRKHFPELCAPEMIEAIEQLKEVSSSISRAESHEGRLSRATFTGWARKVNTVIKIIRESAIRLPDLAEE